jgi:predicted ATPase
VLKRLRIQNFRLLRDVEIDFEEDAPTVFIGPNGSGKSTVLEVLDFLARCSTDGLQAAAIAHGGIHNLRTIGVEEAIAFEMSWSFSIGAGTGMERDWELGWKVALLPAINGSVLVQREELTDSVSKKPRQLVLTNERGARSVVPEDDPNARPSKVASGAKLAFEELVDAKRFAGLFWLNTLLGGMRVIGAISTAPGWARAETSTASPRDSLVLSPKVFLDRQGLGLANVLFSLFNEHGAAWGDLERAFRAEFPFVRRIVFPPDVGGSKIAFAFEDERFPGRKLFASEMSDGMIAYLCLLASVLHPAHEGILGLDEPDANLHPSALRRLMALAHTEIGQRRLAIVTHSNALLDELRDPASSIRIVESTKNGARIRKLDADALAAWRTDYAVSEMRRTGLLDPANSSYGTDE